ncbi:MAG: hypothetical protein UH077_09510 [Bacteroidales bacterium]|nr:hypothetical protein [Bacteroidales bacterium]
MKTLNDYIKAVQELQAMGMEILQHSKDYSAKLDELENMDIHLQCCLNILTSEEEDNTEEYNEEELFNMEIVNKVESIMDDLCDEEYDIVISIIDNYLDLNSSKDSFYKLLNICDKLQVTKCELLEWYSY